MTATFPNPFPQYLDSSGVPIIGAKLEFFVAGTTTQIVTYQDEGLSTPNTNPVLTGSDGRVGPIFLTSTKYKVTLRDASDVLLDTADNLEPGETSAVTDVIDSMFRIVDDGDATKKLAFEVSGIDTATVRTVTALNESGTMVLAAATQTLTNKTIDLTDNTVTGTLAEFNTALSDDDFASLGGNETFTGDKSFDGDITVQGKSIIVESAGSGVDSLAALNTARTAAGVGGVIKLADGLDYELSATFTLNVASQTLIIPSGASITLQSGSAGNAIDVTAANVTITGSGEIDCAGEDSGIIVSSTGKGFRILGDDLTIKDSTARAINASDAWASDSFAFIKGVRVYWTASGVEAAKLVIPLVINCDTVVGGTDLQNLIIRDCIVDYSAWSVEDIAEVSYPSSGNPNTIGIRLRANNEDVAFNWIIDNNQVLLPTATSSADWDPVNHGNSADGAGQRRPTGFEITAIRSTYTYSGKTGTFTAAETVTGGTSGATVVVDTEGSLSFTGLTRVKNFRQGETLTGGTSGATATFESIQGHLRNGKVNNNVVKGGDLQFSFGQGDNISFVGNRMEGNATSYNMEYASGVSVYGSGNYFDSAIAGKNISCTNTKNIHLPGSHVIVGKNSAFPTNSGFSCEGVDEANLTGSKFMAGADSIELIKIATAGSETNFTFVCACVGS